MQACADKLRLPLHRGDVQLPQVHLLSFLLVIPKKKKKKNMDVRERGERTLYRTLSTSSVNKEHVLTKIVGRDSKADSLGVCKVRVVQGDTTQLADDPGLASIV